MGTVPDNQGQIVTTQVADPAAQADWTFTVPTDARGIVSSLKATFTADANSATRTVTLQMTDGSNLLYSDVSTEVTVATETHVYVWYPNATKSAAGAIASGGTVQNPIMFRTPVEATDDFGTSTANIQAGDQWSDIFVRWERWVED